MMVNLLWLGGYKVRKLEYLVGKRYLWALIRFSLREPCSQTIAARLQPQLPAVGSNASCCWADPSLRFRRGICSSRWPGARLHFSTSGRKGESLEEMAASLRQSGEPTLHVIPYGGSNAAGGVGFAAADH